MRYVVDTARSVSARVCPRRTADANRRRRPSEEHAVSQRPLNASRERERENRHHRSSEEHAAERARLQETVPASAPTLVRASVTNAV